MDFMSDAFIGGRKYRTFNVMDDFGREALNITIDTSIRSEYVIRELDQLIEWRGKPERLRVDNGPDFIGLGDGGMGTEQQDRDHLHRARNAHAEWLDRSLQPHLS